MAAEPLGSRLHRLATSIVAGDVVFFIGAGFSVESEGNTADVLIAKLLVRFEAITSAVRADAARAGSPLVDLCERLTGVLPSMFQVKPDRNGVICGKYFARNVRRLMADYYLINDWMCSAFDALLAHADRLQALIGAIGVRERLFAQNWTRRRSVKPLCLSPVDDFKIYAPLVDAADAARAAGTERATAGKALFLDTMGFADDAIMAGKPFHAEFDIARNSYGGRLRDRHAVLAWLALEGVLPVVLTTNYDLLLEGAYRMAGMLPRVPGEAADLASGLEWNRRLRAFTPISDATQFFSHGDGYASALILKIHGCVHEYRQQRKSNDAANWRRVLRTMVFTFREIQNWREDSWSRDYIRTLLRTRTVAFAGYSTADPVLHDTFRSVYEEMASYRVPHPGERADATVAGHERGSAANAYFFRFGSRKEFHGIEILRAASRAAGDAHPELADHPNLLGFVGNGFPTIDHMMLWVYHDTYRQLQRQALESELRRVSYQLFGHPAPHREMDQVVEDFKAILELERTACANLWTGAAGTDPDGLQRASDSSRAFGRIIAWTVQFHRKLMREYAAADVILRKPERMRGVSRAIRWPWYSPLNEHPDWAAWGVVLELALRKRAAAWVGAAEWWTAATNIEPVHADRAAVLVPRTPTREGGVPRVCLSVELPALRQPIDRTRPLRLKPKVMWELRSHTVPWWVDNDSQRPASVPGPQTLWQWAITAPASRPRTDVNVTAFFGDHHVANPGSAGGDGDATTHQPPRGAETAAV